MEAADADAVLRIYQAGLDGGDASFETSAPTWDAFAAAKLAGHSWVAVEGHEILGWSRSPPFRRVASLRLHERAGFRVVGVRERVGRRHGRWRDVVLLERRSPFIGR